MEDVKKKRARLLAAFAVVIVALMVATGCGDSSSSNSSSNSGGGGSSSEPALDIAFVGFAPASDSFWNVVVNGAQHAATDLGVTLHQYLPDRTTLTGADLARLFNAAIAAKPDGIITTDPNPSALNPLIKRATEAGIPVIMVNQGPQFARELGALTFVGSDETQAGRLAGDALTKAGVRHVLYVVVPPGNPTGDARVRGFEEGYTGGRITPLAIPVQSVNDANVITKAIQAALQKDASIDSVMGVTSLFAASMQTARSSLGSRGEGMTWACFDLGPILIRAVSDDRFLFAIDQQQFLQGYLPVQELTHYVRYGIEPVQDFVPTGPLLVTRDNVGKLDQLSAQGVR